MKTLKKALLSIAVSSVIITGCGSSSSSGSGGAESSDNDDSGSIVYAATLVGTKLDGRQEVPSTVDVELHSSSKLAFGGDGTVNVPFNQCIEIRVPGYSPGIADWKVDISSLTEHQYENGCDGNFEPTLPGMIARTNSGLAAISFVPADFEELSKGRTISSISVYYSNSSGERLDVLNGTFVLN